MKKYPWDQKLEIGFWRGKFTGMDLDLFPASDGFAFHNPSPKKVKQLILEDPSRYERVYLSYLSTLHSDYINAALTDNWPLIYH